MTDKSWFRFIAPLGAYVFVISAIALMRIFLIPGAVILLAAALMFAAPFIMRSRVKGLSWSTSGVLIGIAVSVVILGIYLVVIDKPLRFGGISYSLLILQLFFVALPEEVFFRGYLQEKIGNNLKGVLAVSFLFALGHIATRCLLEGLNGSVCGQDLLTFFPSVVMGFLYAVSGTLWGNIAFHFLANIVYRATGGL